MEADFWKLGAVDLATAYRQGEISPVSVVEELRERIEQLDQVLNAFVTLAPDLELQARASAKRFEAGKPLSPLDGVPVAIKDNLHVAGLPTCWGGKTFGDIAENDELPIARLRSAGAILVGKTNTPEFAVEGYTANDRFGVTRNPWDPELTPGGSSGGSVAAVAAGLATLAIGTDGGGSTRRPAGHTGLYGLKPSIGRIARSGGLPQILMDFEVIGGFARNIDDLDLLYGVLAGPDRSDPVSRAVPDFTGTRTHLRVLSVPLLGDNPCDPEILSATRKLGARITDLGHNVVERSLPIDLGPITEFWGAFAQIGLSHLAATTPQMRQKAGSLYLDMADAGDQLPARHLFAALKAVRDLRSATSELFAEWDLIVMPTAAAQPWPAAESHPDTIDGKPVGPRGHAVYTGWINASGHPGLAVPAGFDKAGMPIGVQLIGDLGSEAGLIALARELETPETTWQWPGLARTSVKRVNA